MLSVIFDLKELSMQKEESIKFVKCIVRDLNTIVISNNEEEYKNIADKLELSFSTVKKYETIEDFVDHNKNKVEDWFLIMTNDDYDFNSLGKQFVKCPYEFWGALEQFENNSFTEHAKNKLIYNELSWLYIDSIANDTELEISLLEKVFDSYNIKKILDCCCGVGRHSARLGEDGFEVTGIDISSNQIKTATKRTKSANVNYCVCDVRDFSLPQKYDAAICMWTTYNYLSKEKDILAFLDNVFSHLNDDGILILDSKNIPILDKNRLYHRTTNRDNIDMILIVYKRVMDMVQNSQYFYFINNGDDKNFYIDEEFVRFYTLEELKELNYLKFELINVYGDFEGNAFDSENSSRMITVWQKCKVDK